METEFIHENCVWVCDRNLGHVNCPSSDYGYTSQRVMWEYFLVGLNMYVFTRDLNDLVTVGDCAFRHLQIFV